MNLIRSLVILIILYINKMPLTLGNCSTGGWRQGNQKFKASLPYVRETLSQNRNKIKMIT